MRRIYALEIAENFGTIYFIDEAMPKQENRWKVRSPLLVNNKYDFAIFCVVLRFRLYKGKTESSPSA